MGKLGIYLLANYPDRAIFLDAVRVCEDTGVDFLEVGFPFSDPVADGDLLERASLEALKKWRLSDFVGSFREARTLFPRNMYIMTYTNIVFNQGPASFVRKVAPVSGLVLADLPMREVPLIERLLGNDRVPLIRFLTPESREYDIQKALKGAEGFIYFVSKRGTTGGAFSLDAEMIGKIGRVRGKGIDVYVGFGIRDKKDFELACTAADGAIIGTRAVTELAHGIRVFERFVSSLRG